MAEVKVHAREKEEPRETAQSTALGAPDGDIHPEDLFEEISEPAQIRETVYEWLEEITNCDDTFIVGASTFPCCTMLPGPDRSIPHCDRWPHSGMGLHQVNEPRAEVQRSTPVHLLGSVRSRRQGTSDFKFRSSGTRLTKVELEPSDRWSAG